MKDFYSHAPPSTDSRRVRADLLALLCVIFSCVSITFPYGVSGHGWYFIVSIPDLCLLLYFYYQSCCAHAVWQPLNVSPHIH